FALLERASNTPVPVDRLSRAPIVSPRTATSRRGQDVGSFTREGYMDRRSFVVGAGAATAALALTRQAAAQDAYPTRAITIINPCRPGGASDLVTRPYAAVLEPIIKHPVVVETKAGAAGAVGAQVAASARPDGYTLLSHITSLSGFAEVDRLFGRQPKF